MLTLSNLAMGIFSLLMVFQGRYMWAVVFILFGMLFDFLDGMMARKLNVVSDFGKELDSLSDMVSFGVAPVILCWVIYPDKALWLGICLVLFVLCGACRLAKFNSKRKASYRFAGFPITTAGGLLAILSLYMNYIPLGIFIAVVLALSVSMVSNIPFYSLKSIRTIRPIFLILIALILSLLFFYPFLFAVVLLTYYLSGIVMYFRESIVKDGYF